MKRFSICVEGKSFTPERLERACNFLTDVFSITNTKVDNIVMSFLFDKNKEGEVLSLAEKYGIVNFTK